MPADTETIDLLIIGAGDRGTAYARLTKELDLGLRVVGVAEPREDRRQRFAQEHRCADRAYEDWEELLDAERFADAVVVATPDGLHTEPAVAFLERGYHVLLEKPMATTADLCHRIADAAARAEGVFAVAHVLRYTDYTKRLKGLIDSGLIGDVAAIQRLEPIGFDHFAHSYVRGNWRREEESSFSLLTKACHDIDWLGYVMGRRCEAVASFAELRHFRPESRPAGAADRCLDCRIERSCPYSAKRAYLDRAVLGERGWPMSVVAQDPTVDRLVEALRTGPYGRCVYACDNDVADTQVVNLTFENGGMASFMMTAFAPMGGRRTTVFGTHGQLHGDGRRIEHLDFVTGRSQTIDTLAQDAPLLGGHGGGDGRLLQAFAKAIAEGDRGAILSGPAETLESHLVVFAAERARRERSVVSMSDYRD